jgi:hypothetical protein
MSRVWLPFWGLKYWSVGEVGEGECLLYLSSIECNLLLDKVKLHQCLIKSHSR